MITKQQIRARCLQSFRYHVLLAIRFCYISSILPTKFVADVLQNLSINLENGKIIFIMIAKFLDNKKCLKSCQKTFFVSKRQFKDVTILNFVLFGLLRLIFFLTIK